MKKTQVILIHVICWTVVLGYVYSGYLLNKISFYGAAFGISISLVQIVEFYICFLWVYPYYLKRNKIPQLILGVLVAMGSFIALRYLIEQVVYLHLFGISNYPLNTTASHYITDNIYFASSFIVVSLAIYGAQQNFKDELMNRKLKGEAVKAELAFLKSQINPHFLYNTLNYVYSLAIPVSEQLADAILRLSDLMRYTLTESPDGKVKVSKEIAYLESYIALFKMRFEPNFYVDFKTDGWKETDEIAALMLIPFVENAFKHGVINDAAYPIKIALSIQDKKLLFEVSNKISHSQKDHSSGVGLVNIHRRLDLIYPGQHELIVSHNSNTYKSTLIINL